jgi:exosortase/archaeosortase family protein
MRGRFDVHAGLLAALALMLVVLPFVATFDDFLNLLGTRLGLDAAVQAVARPEAQAVVGVLGWFGVRTVVAGSEILIWDGAGHAQYLLIGATCTGWQSLLLLGLSFLVGLRGPFDSASRVQAVLIGLLGTLLVNIGRMAAVAVIAASSGFVPAVLFHDYGGTALIVLWLFGFWAFANHWLLRPLSDCGEA